MNDQELIKKIKQLGELEPRAAWVKTNRAALLQAINPTQESARLSWLDYLGFSFSLLRRGMMEPVAMLLLLIGFSIGSSLTVNAAFYSLPGEPLYRMKIALENTQVAITPNEQRKVELKIEFAQKRISEFDKIASGQDIASQVTKDRLAVAVSEFQKNVSSVREHINKVGATTADQERTVQIALSVTTETKELAKSLGEKTSKLTEAQAPAEVKAAVDEAIESAEAVSLFAQEIVDQATSTPAIGDDSVNEKPDVTDSHVEAQTATTTE